MLTRCLGTLAHEPVLPSAATPVQETLHMNTAGSMEAAERQSEIQVRCLAGQLAGVLCACAIMCVLLAAC